MLRFEGQAGEVTGHSSYWTDQGYRVTEWSCETEDVEAYLPQLFYLGASLLIGWSL